MQIPIAIALGRLSMPDGFPVQINENSGNLIHWHAPVWMFADHIHQESFRKIEYNFIDYVNKNCGYVILSFADTLRINDDNDERYLQLARFINKIECPIVVFGLGIGNLSRENVETARLTAAQVQLIDTIAQHTPLIGVRGNITAGIIKRSRPNLACIPVGCPSIFARPVEVRRAAQLKIDLSSRQPAFAGTAFHHELERQLFLEAIAADCYLVEPVNRHNHLAAEMSNTKTRLSRNDLPYFLRSAPRIETQLEHITKFYQSRYRLFRNIEDWVGFNQSSVAFTYGTRFHVNMASLISGVPALWLTHDARTSELVELLRLPSIPVEDAVGLSIEDLADRIDFEEFLDHYEAALENFRDYLKNAGIPENLRRWDQQT